MMKDRRSGGQPAPTTWEASHAQQRKRARRRHKADRSQLVLARDVRSQGKAGVVVGQVDLERDDPSEVDRLLSSCRKEGREVRLDRSGQPAESSAERVGIPDVVRNDPKPVRDSSGERDVLEESARGASQAGQRTIQAKAGADRTEVDPLAGVREVPKTDVGTRDSAGETQAGDACGGIDGQT